MGLGRKPYHEKFSYGQYGYILDIKDIAVIGVLMTTVSLERQMF